jgi:hypothetical protein
MGLKKSHQNQEHNCTEGHDSCFEQQRTENQLLSWSPSECSTPANFQKYKLHCNGHENSSRKAQGANISASFCSLCSVVPVLPARPLAKRSPGPPILRTGAATTSPRLRRTDFSGYGRRHRTSPPYTCDHLPGVAHTWLCSLTNGVGSAWLVGHSR